MGVTGVAGVAGVMGVTGVIGVTGVALLFAKSPHSGCSASTNCTRVAQSPNSFRARFSRRVRAMAMRSAQTA